MPTTFPAEARARFDRALADRPEWLRQHTRRVVDGALHLARIHELDPDVCAAAAAGHDLFRHLDPDAILERARARGLTITDADLAAPIVLHGPLAAHYAARELEIDHSDILSAIHYHTNAHPDLSEEALAVFLADKVDPNKVQRGPGLAAVAAAAERDLHAATTLFLERRLSHQLATGQQLHPLAVEARNALLQRV